LILLFVEWDVKPRTYSYFRIRPLRQGQIQEFSLGEHMANVICAMSWCCFLLSVRSTERFFRPNSEVITFELAERCDAVRSVSLQISTPIEWDGRTGRARAVRGSARIESTVRRLI